MNPEHLTDDELLHYAEQRDDPWVAALLRLFGAKTAELDELRKEMGEEIHELEAALGSRPKRSIQDIYE